MNEPMGTERIQWMREHGVLSASWHPDGTLASASLSPYAPNAVQSDPETQSEPDLPKPDDVAQRRAVSLRAGPGFRRISG